MKERYESYKDSGIPWIGQVPQGWECVKMKYLFTERSEKGHPNEPMLCATQKYGVIPQSMYENRVVVVTNGFENLKLVKQGDFVISLRSFQGGIEYAHYRGIISAAYTVLALKQGIHANYIKYLFKSAPFLDLLKMCVTGIRQGQNINYDMLRRCPIPLPPLPEQRAIAGYLDERCTAIDAYVASLEREAALARELKQREIADAVTGKVKITA